MEEVFIIGIVFYFTYLVFSLIMRRKERMMLIEKISELKDVELSNIQLGGAGKYAWLHVGCCACGIGLGILIAFFIELGVRSTNLMIGMDACYSACLCLFGGIGLVVSFIIANKLESEKNKEKNKEWNSRS